MRRAGRVLVKVASLWPVADASGEQMDQAEMMRYPSEMIWFPAAFLAGNISFEAVDDSSARVTSPTMAGPPPVPCSSTGRDGSPTSWPSATGPPAPAARNVVDPDHRLRRIRRAQAARSG